jgi:hypothetical protein
MKHYLVRPLRAFGRYVSKRFGLLVVLAIAGSIFSGFGVMVIKLANGQIRDAAAIYQVANPVTEPGLRAQQIDTVCDAWIPFMPDDIREIRRDICND